MHILDYLILWPLLLAAVSHLTIEMIHHPHELIERVFVTVRH